MPNPNWKGTGELESPCYDVKTKTDCPRRCGGCQINCPEWKAYEVKREELYRQRRIDFQANSVIGDSRHQGHIKYVKKQQRLKRMYR